MQTTISFLKRQKAAALSGLLALTLLAVWTPATAQMKKQDATPVGIDKVVRQPLQQTVPVIGRLLAAQAGVVAARISSPVAEIKANVGDRVEKGAIIASLIKDSLQWKRQLRAAEVKEEESALKTAQVQVDQRNQELKRLKGLRKSAAFSQARYDDKQQEVYKARSAVGEAQAALQTARANLKLAEIDLYNADIRAPFGGVVSKRHTEVGSYLTTGSPVVTLINDLDLEIEADVPAERIPGLKPGTALTFKLDGGKPLKAAVRAVVPEENPLTRTRTVRFTPVFGNGHRNLAANQSVTLLLPAGDARDVVSVHKDAVLNRKGKTLVFMVVDGIAKMRPVQLGEAVGGRFEVKRGLAPGDVVVIRGNERLRPNQKVRPKGSGRPGGGKKPGDWKKKAS
ncbi:MAG: efflux RND transporter periplasmic adaptor subunit [Rhodospirillales bacterium]|nr:efflux RND transporter periplasmic adaptor subunit [Rhodospirillales bacterium]